MTRWSSELEVGGVPPSSAAALVREPNASISFGNKRPSAPMRSGLSLMSGPVVSPSALASSSKSPAVSLAELESESISSRPVASTTQSMVSYPPADQPRGEEWDAAYAAELSKPSPSASDCAEYYTSATWEQKKFLYALGAEAAYWRMRSGNPGTAAQVGAERDFLALLENASPEQRLAIELCINLTKAIQALMLATHPDTDPVSASQAHAVYAQIVAERPDIRKILYYRISRIALARSYSKGTPNPSQAYLAFIAKLDEPALLAVFAMRAAFFDRVMNDPIASSALRSSAAEHYSRLLLSRPGIETYLQQFIKVRTGISLFLSKPDAAALEDPRSHPHGWLAVLNEEEVTRAILHYELAVIFFSPAHKSLLDNPADDNESAQPEQLSQSPGLLAAKTRDVQPLASIEIAGDELPMPGHPSRHVAHHRPASLHRPARHALRSSSAHLHSPSHPGPAIRRQKSHHIHPSKNRLRGKRH